MRLTVITGKGGKIVGTALVAEKGAPEAGVGGPVAGPGQKVQLIDLPKELRDTTDAGALHRELKKYLGAKRKAK